MEEEEDLGTIAMPGFIDILSSVIIMFVFFVLVTAVALYFHVLQFKSKLKKETSLVEIDMPEQEDNALIKQAKSLEKKIAILEKENEVLENVISDYQQQLFQTRAEFTESKNQNIEVLQDNKGMVVFFGRDSISLTKETEEAVNKFIEEAKAKSPNGNIKIEIVAGKTPNAPIESVVRKVSVARIFNVRNTLIETGILPQGISASVDDKSKIDNSHHWVKMVVSYDE